MQQHVQTHEELSLQPMLHCDAQGRQWWERKETQGQILLQSCHNRPSQKVVIAGSTLQKCMVVAVEAVKPTFEIPFNCHSVILWDKQANILLRCICLVSSDVTPPELLSKQRIDSLRHQSQTGLSEAGGQ